MALAGAVTLVLTLSLSAALALSASWLPPLVLGVVLALLPGPRGLPPGLACAGVALGHALGGPYALDPAAWVLAETGQGGVGVVLRDLALAAGSAAGARLLRERLETRGAACLATLALLLLIGGLWLAPWQANPRLVRELAAEPPDHAYAFDGHFYLKVFHLMRRGQGFYEAELEAAALDRRRFELRVPAHFRLPTVFTLWSWLAPGGSRGVLVLYLLGASASLLAAFLLGRGLVRDPDHRDLAGLLAAIALYPLLCFGAVTLYFTFVELWGVFPAIWGVWLALRRRDAGAVTCVLLACLARSLFVYLLAVLVLTWALERRWRSVAGAVGAGLVFLGAYGLHVHQVHQVIQVDAAGVGGWLHPPDLRYLDGTLRFGAALGPLPWATRWGLLALAIALGIQRARRGAAPRWLALLVVAVPATAMLVTGRDPTWGGYWGAIWVPWALSLGGAASVALWLPPSAGDAEPEAVSPGPSPTHSSANAAV